jgi:hypothetical protein
MSTFYTPVPVILYVHVSIQIKPRQVSLRKNFTLGSSSLSWSALCRTQAEVILNHVIPNVCGTGQEEAMHRKYKRLKRGCNQAYDCSAGQLLFWSI